MGKDGITGYEPGYGTEKGVINTEKVREKR